MENETTDEVKELDFGDHKISLRRGENSEFVITQEISKTGKVQKIVIKEKEMISIIKSLES